MRPRILCLACLATLACATPAPGPAGPLGAAAARDDDVHFAGAGWTKPTEKRRGCVSGRFKLPPGAAYSGPVTLKILVRSDGSIGQVERLTPLADGTAPEGTVKRFDGRLEGAVRSCDFEPGLDSRGAPKNTWLILPIVFVRL